jgi:two-component system chemotaxis response regulator CheY
MQKVLVVEDSASTRALVRAILEDAEFADAHGGIEVTEASCGFEAMRLLPRGRYGLIITDINMPDINGLELIQFVRKSQHLKKTPLVIISTQSTERDIERGLALGADAFVPKPFSKELLRETCAKFLTAGGA